MNFSMKVFESSYLLHVRRH